MENITEQKRTIVAQGFLSRLMRLRRVLLQDCAFLQEQQPEHMLLKHDIFRTDAYRTYASAVLDRARTVQSPMDVQLQQVMPQLHIKMNTMSGFLNTGMKDLQSTLQNTVNQNLTEFWQEVMPTLSEVGKIQAKQATSHQLLLTHLDVLAQGLQLITDGTFETRFRHPSGIAGENGEGTRVAVDPSDLLDRVGRLADDLLETRQPLDIPPSTTGSGPSGTPLLTTPSSHHYAPASAISDIFKLEANHATVAVLWTEWTEGVFGRVSVRTMVTKGGEESEAQRKLYARRKVVIDEVVRLAEAKLERSMSQLLSKPWIRTWAIRGPQ